MKDPVAHRVLDAALFTLVPLGYLSVWFWRPLSTYRYGGNDTGYFCPILMTAVLFVSVLSWNRHRMVTLFGLIAFSLWFAFWIQPVI